MERFLNSFSKTIIMKRIFLLSLLFVAVCSVIAQPSKKGIDNVQTKNNSIALSQIMPEAAIENMSVYPNPVVDFLRITFKSNLSGIIEVVIFNNIGKRVYSQESAIETGNNLISIDIRSKAIEPGIYFIQCVAEKEVFTRKLIVK